MDYSSVYTQIKTGKIRCPLLPAMICAINVKKMRSETQINEGISKSDAQKNPRKKMSTAQKRTMKIPLCVSQFMLSHKLCKSEEENKSLWTTMVKKMSK